jgi:transposase InsO family protein
MDRSIDDIRIEAVKRYLSGESASDIAKDLKKGRRWLYKWVRRYEISDDNWFKERSRRPLLIANRTSADIENLVLEVRERLEQTKYAQIGANAIQWELKKLGAERIPEIWTINRILARNGKVRRKQKYEPKLKSYPSFLSDNPNDLQQGDILGPRYIKGGWRFYSLNVMDIARHKVALSPIRTKQDMKVTDALISAWRRLGIPKFFQMDNELVFRGSNRYPRSFGDVIGICLALGIEPVFIPVGEPWRNAEIERFQDIFDKKFFRTQVFISFEELLEQAEVFEVFHNENHRYSVLKGKTPQEIEERLSFRPIFPTSSFKMPKGRPNEGKIHLVRFIRSDSMLDVFSEKIRVISDLVYEYVVATICVKEQKLEVVYDGKMVQEFDYRLYLK